MAQAVLISCAGSGSGKGVALGLAERGQRVIAGCQIWPQVWELRRNDEKAELSIEVIKLDVLTEIDRTYVLSHEIEVLFSNAGIMESGRLMEIPMSVFRSVFEIDVFAALELAQCLARAMILRGSGRTV